MLLTKFGNVFITGNYNVKEKSEDKNNNIVKENNKGKIILIKIKKVIKIKKIGKILKKKILKMKRKKMNHNYKMKING